MTPDLSTKQIWQIRACLTAPLLLSTAYHVARLYPHAGPRSLLILFITAVVSVIAIYFLERKYEYKVPSRSEVSVYAFIFILMSCSHFAIEYSFHTRNKLGEGIDSIFSLLILLPSLMFIGSKKDKRCGEPV